MEKLVYPPYIYNMNLGYNAFIEVYVKGWIEGISDEDLLFFHQSIFEGSP